MDTLFPVNAVAGAPAYSGRMLRQAGSVLLAGGTAARPLGARSGVRPGTGAVSADSTSWWCGPIAGVIDGEPAAEAGPYTFAFDTAASGVLTAANASNPRIDIIFVQVDDPSESDGTSAPAVRRGYLAGVAAATPSAPAAPARSFVVAQINVPKAGSGSPTASLVAPYAVAAGGLVPASSLADLNASIAGYPGQYASVSGDADPANDGLYRWVGSAWSQVVGDTGWITPSFTNGWQNFGGSFQAVAIRRLNGVVHMRGMMKSGSPGTAFALPSGFRVAGTRYFSAPSGTGTAFVSVDAAGVGVVTYSAGGANADVSLNFSYLPDA